MIDFGCSLKRAREAKGLSIKDLAQATHIMAQTLEDIENENFSRISAPIYGRGFIKLYCEAVGLESKPFVDEFMDIYNGNRPAVIRMRAGAERHATDAPPPAPDATGASPAADEPATTKETAACATIAATAPQVEPAHKIEPITATEPPSAEPSLFEFRNRQPAADSAANFATEKPAKAATAQPDPRGPSRYAAPLPIDDDNGANQFKLEIPPAFWRILVVIGGALALLWLAFASVRALYRVSMKAPDGEKTGAVVSPAENPAAQTAKPKPAAPRTPRAIEPLYID